MPEIRQVTEAEFGTSDSSPAAIEVRRIAEACDAFDAVITLNEQACLQLKYRGLRDANLWLVDGGFAFRHGEMLDLAVHPEVRNQGIGMALATAALGAEHVEAWSHADHPAASKIAARFGVPRERELKIMSRPTTVPATDLNLPAGTRIRSFRPDDTDQLLEINAHAFRHHPEQGHMTVQDFTERTKESWFDPEGLFVATDEHDKLLGFHWTKLHRDEEPAYGEVYVVAVSPKAAGRGLGKVLTQVGLQHLANTGVGEVILYVDGDNDPAIAVYKNQGFSPVRTEVQYRGVPTIKETSA